MCSKKKISHVKSLASIAEECDVSIMTVSRALRGAGPVKESTRDMILKVAEKIGYLGPARRGRPSSPVNNARPTMEVIIGFTGRTMTLFYSELLTTIEMELSRFGYDCIIRTVSGEYEQFVGLVNILKNTVSRGVMLVGHFEPEQLERLIAVVPGAILIDNPGFPSIKLPFESICFDNVEAARMAIRHLLEIGRRRIVLLKGASGHYFSREMEQGYREVLSDVGIVPDPDLIRECDFTSDTALEIISSMIKKDIYFDAVFTNDEMACCVYRALHLAGKKIPDDVAVCGCDGLPVSKQIIPALTTVVLDYAELGKNAVVQLLERAGETRSSALKRIRLLPELEVRESTKAHS